MTLSSTASELQTLYERAKLNHKSRKEIQHKWVLIEARKMNRDFRADGKYVPAKRVSALKGSN